MLESKNGLATALGQIQRAELLLQAGRGSEAWLSVAPLRQAIDRHGKALRSYARMAMAVGQIDAAVAALGLTALAVEASLAGWWVAPVIIAGFLALAVLRA